MHSLQYRQGPMKQLLVRKLIDRLAFKAIADPGPCRLESYLLHHESTSSQYRRVAGLCLDSSAAPC